MSSSFHQSRENHIRIGRYIKDIVFAAHDGIITIFAIVAGVAGAHLSSSVVIIIGMANLIADAFAMATGMYLGASSEAALYHREEARERREIQELPDREKEEIRHILAQKGFRNRDLDAIVELIAGNRQYWIDFMMHEEIGLAQPDTVSPFRKSAITFLSFLCGGSIPLIPYITGTHSFTTAILATMLTLFIIGAVRSYFTERSWLASGIEMLLIGGSAAAMAYGIGLGLRTLVPNL